MFLPQLSQCFGNVYNISSTHVFEFNFLSISLLMCTSDILKVLHDMLGDRSFEFSYDLLRGAQVDAVVNKANTI